MTKVLEGTWAEIAAHADEWNGGRLRVEIEELPANGAHNGASATAPDNSEEGPTLLELLGDIVGSVSGMPEDLGRNHKKYYAQAMDEKYPRDDKCS